MKKIITRFIAAAIVASSIAAPATAAVLSEPSKSSSATTAPSDEKINAALNEFKTLSKKEKRERIKEVKSVLKKYKADKKAGRAADSDTNTLLLVILAIFLPPLAVYLHENELNTKFWISLVLTILFWIPGVIYALLVVFDAI
jgi:uncharacterized membrane protein YqaE (UPF0057 family)